ncbi:MAG: AAA family ATPase, partial [Eubacteriaceae bacterium]|nr:AAA family ATPase [Eubacteriaceae bacterium]
MKIKTLNLLAFGKFIDKTIEIDDGFNLIFGGNEAGKSTVQHFIEGMLFGFYKPYRKKRTYNENYYHYKPRHSDKYYGSMIMEDDNGKEIRIERDFLKTRDGVRIFNNITGEEITQTYPYDHVTKQYLPLGYGSVNSVVYNNTVNFKQMASRSDDDLAKEVNNRLVDLVTDNS